MSDMKYRAYIDCWDSAESAMLQLLTIVLQENIKFYFRQDYTPGTTESGENIGTQVANWKYQFI